jgi:hypothetical protein
VKNLSLFHSLSRVSFGTGNETSILNQISIIYIRWYGYALHNQATITKSTK